MNILIYPRNSSAMYSLPDLEALDNAEREHIEQVLQKAEQSQAPFIISSISQSKSVGDIGQQTLNVELGPDESDSSVNVKTKQETPAGLSKEEIEYIRRMEAMIAETEMMDSKGLQRIETAKETSKVDKKSMFGGFKLGGGLKDALKVCRSNLILIYLNIQKTSQRMNENVSALASVIDNSSGMKPTISFADSFKRLTAKTQMGSTIKEEGNNV